MNRHWLLMLFVAALLILAGQVAVLGDDPVPTPPPPGDPVETVTPTPTSTPTPYRLYLYFPFMSRPVEPVTVTVELQPKPYQLWSASYDYQAALEGRDYAGAYDASWSRVGQIAQREQFYAIEKAFLFFDTSDIPATAEVISATFKVSKCTRSENTQPFTVEFYRTEAPLPPTQADWLNYDGLLLGAFQTKDCGLWAGWRDIEVELNPQSIAKGRMTVYALISDRVRQGLRPEPWGTSESIAFDTTLAASALQVTYVNYPTR